MKVGTLHYDRRKEEGVIKWEKGVDFSQPNVVLLDTLQDLIRQLDETYLRLHHTTFGGFNGDA